MGDCHDDDQDPPDSHTMTADELLDDLDDCGTLSDWELNFVDGMLRRREQNPLWEVRLSPKQIGCLRRIWEQRCG